MCLRGAQVEETPKDEDGEDAETKDDAAALGAASVSISSSSYTAAHWTTMGLVLTVTTNGRLLVVSPLSGEVMNAIQIAPVPGKCLSLFLSAFLSLSLSLSLGRSITHVLFVMRRSLSGRCTRASGASGGIKRER